MARFARFASIALSTALVSLSAGCATATSTEVTTPDGNTAYDVTCINGRWACDEEARRVCGGGPYVMLDDDAATTVLSRGRRGAVRVQCADDYVASRTPSVFVQQPSDTPNAEVVCRAAYREVADLARGWSAARGGVAKLKPPPEAAFLKACLPLPTRAQQCLNTIYRQDHRKTCSSTLGGLSDEAKGRLDDALLVDRPDAPPRVPGTLDL